VNGADTLLNAIPVEIEADMVVLATAGVANEGAEELAQKLHVSYDPYHFFAEAHPKLKPVETNTAGIFLAGACQAPRDIPESVAMASGAAAKVAGLPLSTVSLHLFIPHVLVVSYASLHVLTRQLKKRKLKTGPEK
jgi:heterodisulfide reductase subunit A